MPKTDVRHYIGIGEKGIGVEVTQGRGLDRTADLDENVRQRLGQIFDEHFPEPVFRGAIQDQTEGPGGIVLADQHNRTVEERAAQKPAVEQQLPLQRFKRFWRTHNVCNLQQACVSDNTD
jgi:hypothetical protein